MVRTEPASVRAAQAQGVGRTEFAVVRRPAPGEESAGKGHNGGLVLMGVGGVLTFVMLAYLMLAQ